MMKLSRMCIGLVLALALLWTVQAAGGPRDTDSRIWLARETASGELNPVAGGISRDIAFVFSAVGHCVRGPSDSEDQTDIFLDCGDRVDLRSIEQVGETSGVAGRLWWFRPSLAATAGLEE